ncbi:hypothetical protein DIPPA_29559 [Diplonema papillatum]|nr:hypothetical protein DIPPA_29559 [Diplonema papillatum]
MPRRHSMSVHRTPSWQTEAAEVTTAALQLRIQNLERGDFLPERRAVRAKYKPQIKKAQDALKKAEASRCRAIVEVQLEGSSAIDPVVLAGEIDAMRGLLSELEAGFERENGELTKRIEEAANEEMALGSYRFLRQTSNMSNPPDQPPSSPPSGRRESLSSSRRDQPPSTHSNKRSTIRKRAKSVALGSRRDSVGPRSVSFSRPQPAAGPRRATRTSLSSSLKKVSMKRSEADDGSTSSNEEIISRYSSIDSNLSAGPVQRHRNTSEPRRLSLAIPDEPIVVPSPPSTASASPASSACPHPFPTEATRYPDDRSVGTPDPDSDDFAPSPTLEQLPPGDTPARDPASGSPGTGIQSRGSNGRPASILRRETLDSAARSLVADKPRSVGLPPARRSSFAPDDASPPRRESRSPAPSESSAAAPPSPAAAAAPVAASRVESSSFSAAADAPAPKTESGGAAPSDLSAAASHPPAAAAAQASKAEDWGIRSESSVAASSSSTTLDTQAPKAESGGEDPFDPSAAASPGSPPAPKAEDWGIRSESSVVASSPSAAPDADVPKAESLGGPDSDSSAAASPGSAPASAACRHPAAEVLVAAAAPSEDATSSLPDFSVGGSPRAGGAPKPGELLCAAAGGDGGSFSVADDSSAQGSPRGTGRAVKPGGLLHAIAEGDHTPRLQPEDGQGSPCTNFSIGDEFSVQRRQQAPLGRASAAASISGSPAGSVPSAGAPLRRQDGVCGGASSTAGGGSSAAYSEAFEHFGSDSPLLGGAGSDGVPASPGGGPGAAASDASAPSAAPETATPSAAPATNSAPETATPSAAPATNSAPETATPKAAPATNIPSAAPVTGTPSAAPETATPSAAPATNTPSAAPETATPSAAPATNTPSAAPVTGTPSAAPSAAPETTVPSAAPVTDTPSAAPETTVPSAAPVTDTPSAAPEKTVPSAAPVTDTPSAAPETTVPSAAPATDTPSAAPDTDTPGLAPSSDGVQPGVPGEASASAGGEEDCVNHTVPSATSESTGSDRSLPVDSDVAEGQRASKGIRPGTHGHDSANTDGEEDSCVNAAVPVEPDFAEGQRASKGIRPGTHGHDSANTDGEEDSCVNAAVPVEPDFAEGQRASKGIRPGTHGHDSANTDGEEDSCVNAAVPVEPDFAEGQRGSKGIRPGTHGHDSANTDGEEDSCVNAAVPVEPDFAEGQRASGSNKEPPQDDSSTAPAATGETDELASPSSPGGVKAAEEAAGEARKQPVSASEDDKVNDQPTASAGAAAPKARAVDIDVLPSPSSSVAEETDGEAEEETNAQQGPPGQPHTNAQQGPPGQPHTNAQQGPPGQPHTNAQQGPPGQPHTNAQQGPPGQPHNAAAASDGEVSTTKEKSSVPDAEEDKPHSDGKGQDQVPGIGEEKSLASDEVNTRRREETQAPGTSAAPVYPPPNAEEGISCTDVCASEPNEATPPAASDGKSDHEANRTPKDLDKEGGIKSTPSADGGGVLDKETAAVAVSPADENKKAHPPDTNDDDDKTGYEGEQTAANPDEKNEALLPAERAASFPATSGEDDESKSEAHQAVATTSPGEENKEPPPPATNEEDEKTEHEGEQAAANPEDEKNETLPPAEKAALLPATSGEGDKSKNEAHQTAAIVSPADESKEPEEDGKTEHEGEHATASSDVKKNATLLPAEKSAPLPATSGEDDEKSQAHQTKAAAGPADESKELEEDGKTEHDGDHTAASPDDKKNEKAAPPPATIGEDEESRSQPHQTAAAAISPAGESKEPEEDKTEREGKQNASSPEAEKGATPPPAEKAAPSPTEEDDESKNQPHQAAAASPAGESKGPEEDKTERGGEQTSSQEAEKGATPSPAEKAAPPPATSGEDDESNSQSYQTAATESPAGESKGPEEDETEREGEQNAASPEAAQKGATPPPAEKAAPPPATSGEDDESNSQSHQTAAVVSPADKNKEPEDDKTGREGEQTASSPEAEKVAATPPPAAKAAPPPATSGEGGKTKSEAHQPAAEPAPPAVPTADGKEKRAAPRTSIGGRKTSQRHLIGHARASERDLRRRRSDDPPPDEPITAQTVAALKEQLHARSARNCELGADALALCEEIAYRRSMLGAVPGAKIPQRQPPCPPGGSEDLAESDPSVGRTESAVPSASDGGTGEREKSGLDFSWEESAAFSRASCGDLSVGGAAAAGGGAGLQDDWLRKKAWRWANGEACEADDGTGEWCDGDVAKRRQVLGHRRAAAEEQEAMLRCTARALKVIGAARTEFLKAHGDKHRAIEACFAEVARDLASARRRQAEEASAVRELEDEARRALSAKGGAGGGHAALLRREQLQEAVGLLLAEERAAAEKRADLDRQAELQDRQLARCGEQTEQLETRERLCVAQSVVLEAEQAAAAHELAAARRDVSRIPARLQALAAANQRADAEEGELADMQTSLDAQRQALESVLAARAELEESMREAGAKVADDEATLAGLVSELSARRAALDDRREAFGALQRKLTRQDGDLTARHAHLEAKRANLLEWLDAAAAREALVTEGRTTRSNHPRKLAAEVCLPRTALEDGEASGELQELQQAYLLAVHEAQGLSTEPLKRVPELGDDPTAARGTTHHLLPVDKAVLRQCALDSLEKRVKSLRSQLTRLLSATASSPGAADITEEQGTLLRAAVQRDVSIVEELRLLDLALQCPFNSDTPDQGLHRTAAMVQAWRSSLDLLAQRQHRKTTGERLKVMRSALSLLLDKAPRLFDVCFTENQSPR